MHSFRGSTWAWGHYRRAEAACALGYWLNAVRDSREAAKRATKAASAKASGQGAPAKAPSKFAALADKCLKLARENLEELDLISLDMELAAAEVPGP